MESKPVRILSLTVLVCSLGYFVDMFDLLLFPILRQPSLTSMGIIGPAQIVAYRNLLNSQMIGMLLGGIFWGMLGDKKGRLSTLFGSIALYSIANIANAFVHTTSAYMVWRFISGFGLAGELGAAVTLVSELLPKEKRGYGTTIVAATGIFGTVMAGLVARTCPGAPATWWAAAWGCSCWCCGSACGKAACSSRCTPPPSPRATSSCSSRARSGWAATCAASSSACPPGSRSASSSTFRLNGRRRWA